MMKLTVKASGHQVGTLVAVMIGNPSNTSSSWVVGKLIRADRGYGLVSTADECVSAWGASKAVYITTPNATQVAAWHRNGMSEAAAERDLWERAKCLGYTSNSAYSVSQCFTNWDHVSDPCPVHPNHSTTMRDGYLVDACEACEIIARTDADGYYPGKWDAILAGREAEYVEIMERDITQAYAAGECACDLIMEMGAKRLPTGGRVCRVCGSVFTPEGTEASPEVLAESGSIVSTRQFEEFNRAQMITRNASNRAYVTALEAKHEGPDYPGDVAVAVRQARADIRVAMHTAGIDIDSGQAHSILTAAYSRALAGGRDDLGLADRYRTEAGSLIKDELMIADQRARKAAEAIECNSDESLRADERDNMTGVDMIRELLTIDL